ncbi:hypothetical protein M758_UG118700 [Ceratodon purpureus]|nr:hypothetical protein M758_UG118700 [Ceratodon purpureus]
MKLQRESVKKVEQSSSSKFQRHVSICMITVENTNQRSSIHHTTSACTSQLPYGYMSLILFQEDGHDHYIICYSPEA